MRQSANSHILHGDNVRTCCAAPSTFIVQNVDERLVIVRNNYPDTQGSEDKEAPESPIAREEISQVQKIWSEMERCVKLTQS